ncbi:MAG: hypothetical protein ACJ76Z_10465 [Thermoleophilaceae bacterium]
MDSRTPSDKDAAPAGRTSLWSLAIGVALGTGLVLYGMATAQSPASTAADPVQPSTPGPAAGTPADPTRPLLGGFRAQSVGNSFAALDRLTGEPMTRSWGIAKHCGRGSACTYTMTRSVAGGPDQTGQLVRESDGWHVTFPTTTFPCRCPSGAPTVYSSSASYVVRFDLADRTAVADEVHRYASPCAHYVSRLEWRASLVPS